MSGEVSIAKILAAEAEALRLESEVGVQIPTWHHFAEGLCARTIFVPAGVAAFGAAHLVEQINICHGDMTVRSGDELKRYTGFHVIPSSQGVKRQGFAHSDTWWTTVYANPDGCTDERELERRHYAEADLMQTARMQQPLLAMEDFQ